MLDPKPFLPSTITNMTDTIIRSGLAYSNRFEVLIDAPVKLQPVLFQNKGSVGIRNLCLRCESVTIPGKALTTVPNRIYGPARQMPVEPVYSGELSMSFILSEDLRERQFFEFWMNMISNSTNYKLSYYKDYVTTIQINVLNRADNIIHTAFVEEAYPKSIGDLQMGYEKDNEIMRQEITIAFRKYRPMYSLTVPEVVQNAMNYLVGKPPTPPKQ